MPAPVRLGVIGAGRWGRICLRTLSGITAADLVAVASGNPETATLVPPGCRIFADWRELIGSAGVEGLVVATPPATHAAIAAAAIEAGLPVFVEKPLTQCAEEARKLRALAGARGNRVFFTDHIHLFSPAFRRLKQLAADAGPILSVEGRAGNHGPYRRDSSVLWDWGAHDVAMLIDLFGARPDRVTAQRLERRRVGNDEGETIGLELAFGSATARIVVSTLCDKVRRFTVRCAAGSFLYDDLAPAKLTRDGAPVTLEPAPPLTQALGEFIAAIRDDQPHRTGLELGVFVVETLEEAQHLLESTVAVDRDDSRPWPGC